MTDVVSNYRVGDVIRATKGEAVIQGKLTTEDNRGPRLEEAGWGVANLIEFGWIIEILERGPEPKPTESGWYLDHEGDVFWLDGKGTWWHDDSCEERWDHEVHEPRRIYTKEEVLTWVRKAAYAIDPDYMYGGSTLNKLVRNLEVSG